MITVDTTTQIEIETYHSGLIKDEIPLDPCMPIRDLLPPRCSCPRCCCYVRLVVLWVLICAVAASPNLTPGHYRLQLSNVYSQRMSSRYKPSLPNFLLPSRLLRQESLERRKNNPIHFHSTLLWRKRLFTLPRPMMRCSTFLLTMRMRQKCNQSGTRDPLIKWGSRVLTRVSNITHGFIVFRSLFFSSKIDLQCVHFICSVCWQTNRAQPYIIRYSLPFLSFLSVGFFSVSFLL